MKSKVTEVKPHGQWQSQYGLLYKYYIYMEDGNFGEYQSKKCATMDHPEFPFKVGEETEYEYEGGQYPKIKPPKKVFGGSGFGGGGRSEEGMDKRCAMMQAVELIKELIKLEPDFKWDKEFFFSLANDLHDWLRKK